MKFIRRALTLALAVCMVCLCACGTKKPDSGLTLETVGGPDAGNGELVVGSGEDELTVLPPGTLNEVTANINNPDPDEFKATEKFAFDFLGLDTMPLAAWVSPTQSYLTPQYMKDYADSGLNVFIPFSLGNDYDTLTKMLDLCEQNRMVALLEDKFCGNYEYSDESLVKGLAPYIDSPAFGGFSMFDEPGAARFDMLGRKSENFYNNYNRRLAYMNLTGLGGGPYVYEWGSEMGSKPLTRPELNDQMYYTEYLQKCKPKVLSADMYPMHGSFPSIIGSHFTNMNTVRKFAKSSAIPYWYYIQVDGWANSASVSYRACTEPEILWQVNTALAFGAKGLNYFTYWKPVDNSIASFNGSMVNEYGEKQSAYYAVQRANKLVLAVDDVLMNANFAGVMRAGWSPCAYPAEEVLASYGPVTGVSGGAALVGCFDYRGRQAYYLVNNTITDAGSVTLTFTGKKSYTLVTEAGAEQGRDSEVTVSLDPGAAALVTL